MEFLFIMRSFSKAFGLAGIRIGYLLGNPKQIDYVSKTRTGYEINSVSMEICSFFIERFHVVEEYIQQVKDGLSYLKSELAHSGFHDGWVIKGLQEELNQLEAKLSRRNKNVKI